MIESNHESAEAVSPEYYPDRMLYFFSVGGGGGGGGSSTLSTPLK